MLCAACAGTGTRELHDPVTSEASAAFEEARAWARSADPVARDRARDALARASAAAPDWVAPLRMADALDVEDLLGLDVLVARRAALAREPEGAVGLYLLGRLEGERGGPRFELAARVAPELAWAHHGLGWSAAQRRDFAAAIAHCARAAELARDPWERSYFTAAIARYHLLAEAPRKALEVLRARLEASDLSALDRVELTVQTAAIELSMYFQPEFQSGWKRALALLRESDLTDDEVDELVRRMRMFRSSDSALLELQLALASRSGAARDRARAEILLDQRPSALALGLLRRAGHGESAGTGPLLRAARFAAGQFSVAVEEWLSDLPAAVLDEQGEPRDARLKTLVEAARATTADSSPEALERLGGALLAAGWFREARAVAASLAAADLDRALALDDAASASQQLLTDLALASIDGRKEGAAATADPRAPSDLDLLLANMAEAFARANVLRGGETDAQRLSEQLVASPRMSYAALATLVHPGPSFSALDEAEGRGREGERVGGLASLLDGLGRFGLFGKLVGDEVDGTILSRVLAERREGEHLGVPWSGTVVWCEGADLRSRAGRLGAEISGAALHEGYWVDIDSLRRERAPWVDLERRMWGSNAEPRIARALATRGLELDGSLGDGPTMRRARRDDSALLQESDRVRLAVLAERRASGARGMGISLDELLEATSIHEQAHLCDRTRFLPLQRNLGRLIALAVRSGLSPEGISRRLEYRAQLVALCEVRDPRVPLVSVLRAAEGGANDVTPHGDAYRELLEDFLTLLDAELARDPAAFPELSPRHVLGHQLHHLRPESLRRLARELARREGLFER
jgi:hypothetical protein